MGFSIFMVVACIIALVVYLGARLGDKKKWSKDLEMTEKGIGIFRQVMGWILAGLIMLTIIVSIHLFLVKVPPGHVGIPIVFGNVGDTVYTSGLHLKSPIADITKMSTQERRVSMIGKWQSRALSRDGMEVYIDVSWQYRVKGDKCAWILRNKVYSDIENYQKDYVYPELRRVVRDVVADYTAQDLYTKGRIKAGDDMYNLGNELLDKNGCELVAVNLRKVTLPKRVTEAIERKKEREQQSEEYDYKLEVEKKEAERKRIEAEGIRDFQKIVVEGVTPSLLKWRSLEVAEKIAASSNSKVVFFGGDDPPFILGGM